MVPPRPGRLGIYMLVLALMPEVYVVAGKDELAALLKEASLQVSEALEAGAITGGSRSEARQLLLDAWLAIQSRSSLAIRERRRYLLGRLAGLVEHVQASSRPMTTIHRLVEVRDPVEPPLLSMAFRHEAVAKALASRTLRMVEKAFEAGGKEGRGRVHAQGSSEGETRRDDLELVVDET